MPAVLEEQLLDAHVRYELSQWGGDALSQRIIAHTAALFAWFDEVKLDDVCTRAQVEGVIERYAVDFRVGGGLTELWGEFTRIVHTSPTSARVRVDQVLSDHLYEDFAEKLASLEGVRRAVSQWMGQSSAIELVGARMVVGDVLSSMFPAARHPTRPALRQVHARLRTRWLPRLEQHAERFVERVFAARPKRDGAVSTRVLDRGSFRTVLDDIWATMSTRRLSSVFAAICQNDLEDFVVLGYEFWLRFRKSEYFRSTSRELVDHFFCRYGQASLALLLEDIGVTQEMVAHELNTFLTPLLNHALEGGSLERQLRASFEPFYRSEPIACLLAGRAVPAL